jgi:hypothetical protein
MVTIRRDSIESAPDLGGPAGAPAVGPERGVPQDGQNCAPSGSSVPQLEHAAPSGVPQDAQNLAPAADSAPHCGQNGMR